MNRYAAAELNCVDFPVKMFWCVWNIWKRLYIGNLKVCVFYRSFTVQRGQAAFHSWLARSQIILHPAPSTSSYQAKYRSFSLYFLLGDTTSRAGSRTTHILGGRNNNSMCSMGACFPLQSVRRIEGLADAHLNKWWIVFLVGSNEIAGLDDRSSSGRSGLVLSFLLHPAVAIAALCNRLVLS